MRAVYVEKPHSYEVCDMPDPEPGPDEVLVRVKACSFCGSDTHLIEGKMPGVVYPLIPGHEWSGEVVSAGERVDEFAPGDRVTTESHAGCGRCANCVRGYYTICENYGRRPLHRQIGMTTNGGFAQYCAVPVKLLHRLPEGMPYTTGTLMTTAGTAIVGLERCGVETGDRVLIYGAGAIGLLTMQFAQFLGAGEVCIVDTVASRLEIAKQLGADVTVCAGVDDLDVTLAERGWKLGPDLTVEAAGVGALQAECIRRVRRGGRVLLLGITGGEEPPAPLNRLPLDQITIYGIRGEGDYSVQRAVRAYESGRIDSSAINTHVFTLEEFAHGFEVFSGKAAGAIKVVLEC
ncbi:MAG: alcohol dehydrogenase catalytic domain-containing protein [Nitrospinaceae bacterium]|nr:alcohol dehydrogenase catalytic domain-containing protein [Nitrospinaceae bacterium]